VVPIDSAGGKVHISKPFHRYTILYPILVNTNNSWLE